MIRTKDLKQVPKMRFPEFNGEWISTYLREGILLISGQHLSPEEYTSVKSGIPYFTGPSDFTNHEKYLSKWTMLKKHTGETGDVLITVKGSGVGTLLLLELPEVALGRQLMAIRSSGYSTSFVYQFLTTKKNLYVKLAYGNMIPGLSRQDVLQTKLTIPTLPEQEKIASFLSAVDNKIQQLTAKKELLEQYKKGVMQRIFSQEIRFTDENGKDYPDWEKKDFGEMVKKTKTKYNPVTDDGDFPCIEMESIAKENGILLEVFSSKKQKSIKNKFKNGDILFGKLRPNLKKYLVAPFDGVCSSEIWVLTGINVLNDYLFALIQTNRFYRISNVTSGSKMPRSDWDYISTSPFTFPTIPEQQKIASFLSNTDKKIESVQSQLTQTQTFKKGLLQQLFV